MLLFQICANICGNVHLDFCPSELDDQVCEVIKWQRAWCKRTKMLREQRQKLESIKNARGLVGKNIVTLSAMHKQNCDRASRCLQKLEQLQGLPTKPELKLQTELGGVACKIDSVELQVKQLLNSIQSSKLDQEVSNTSMTSNMLTPKPIGHKELPTPTATTGSGRRRMQMMSASGRSRCVLPLLKILTPAKS